MTAACRNVRERLGDYAANRLASDARAEIAAHLAGCEGCRHAAAVEGELDAALGRLPIHRAPAALRRRLEALGVPTSDARAANDLPAASAGRANDGATTNATAATTTAATTAIAAATNAPATVRSRPLTAGAAERRSPAHGSWRLTFAALGGAAVAAALVIAGARFSGPSAAGGGAQGDLVAEAVNDHLRVVGSTHPYEIESGGIHQVKPWFTGRLDFAPRVTFAGDGEYVLAGGSIGYFRDRKAAVFSFKLRLHTITLLVFPADGLPWATEGLVHAGRVAIAEQTSRGFSVLMWRDGGLGYALVSDVNAHDLETLATKINE